LFSKSKPKTERKKALEEYISKKRLKATKQRDTIFDEFFNHTGQHITVEELYENVKSKIQRLDMPRYIEP
jgi:Fe2+ or Zn2+ uptake regulation protein